MCVCVSEFWIEKKTHLSSIRRTTKWIFQNVCSDAGIFVLKFQICIHLYNRCCLSCQVNEIDTQNTKVIPFGMYFSFFFVTLKYVFPNDFVGIMKRSTWDDVTCSKCATPWQSTRIWISSIENWDGTVFFFSVKHLFIYLFVLCIRRTATLCPFTQLYRAIGICFGSQSHRTATEK